MRKNPARLQQLQQLAILDTAAERVYDDLTRLLQESLAVPISMVNLLDAERDWFKSCVGFPAAESTAETSFCEVFFSTATDLVVVEDTTLDPRFSLHPLVAGPPHIRFYAAARLTVNGQTVGTLCAYDVQPHQVTQAQLADLQALANSAMQLMAARGTSAE
ncbi:MAG: GAF domain-containing protein [Burkholderiaceae bacterium]|nr:GAF domain-containing protein [Burkholderiaceae bacterium]